MPEEKRDVTALPLEARWCHANLVAGIVREYIAGAVRTYPPSQPVTITVRRPTRDEGCWCYRNGRGLDGRPHEHVHELGGCPVEPAGDNFVWLEVAPA